MQNIGKGQFTFDVLKNAYDSDPRIKELITNFDKEKVELKGSAVDDVNGSQQTDTDSVGKMAQTATDLSSGL
jgi:hypothetical protein